MFSRLGPITRQGLGPLHSGPSLRRYEYGPAMIRIAIEKVKSDQVQALREWMSELMRRQSEVHETFRQEGVRHEQAHLVETSDGFFLIYAMQADDHEKARSAFRNSALPIDIEYKHVMDRVLEGKVPSELLYDCSVFSNSR